MRVAVSGSIATDYLMTFPGRFREQIVPDRLEDLSLSFLIDGLEVRRGGVAANISFGLGLLGLDPLLVGAVGSDFFAEYAPHLEAAGVDLSAVHVAADARTAMFLCTTDNEENQIASFYPGAMAEAGDIDLREALATHGVPEMVVVCPNEPSAMLRHTRETLESGWTLAADPSQQLPRLDGEEVRALIDGATYLFSNSYEAALIASKSGWSDREVLAHIGTRVTTHGPKGCTIQQAGQPSIEVAAVPTADGVTLEPTGIGDAFRSGFIAGITEGLPLERCAQIGSLIATETLESVGSQEHHLDGTKALERLARAYGDDAAADSEGLLAAR